jgi:hypothetical protein
MIARLFGNRPGPDGLTGMKGCAITLKMKNFTMSFTLTVMGRCATPLIMKDFPVIFTLTGEGLK